MTDMAGLPTPADVQAARARLASHLAPSPLVLSEWLSSIADASVHLKLESLQRTGSFKIRGALNAALRLDVNGGGRAVVVTASAGNHGKALALATEQLGIPLVVFTPRTAPETKKTAIRRHGAVLRDEAEDYDAAEQAARRFATSEGGV